MYILLTLLLCSETTCHRVLTGECLLIIIRTIITSPRSGKRICIRRATNGYRGSHRAVETSWAVSRTCDIRETIFITISTEKKNDGWQRDIGPSLRTWLNDSIVTIESRQTNWLISPCCILSISSYRVVSSIDYLRKPRARGAEPTNTTALVLEGNELGCPWPDSPRRSLNKIQ